MKSSAPITKKPHILPGLSSEKQMAVTSQKGVSNERRGTLEKRKKIETPHSLK